VQNGSPQGSRTRAAGARGQEPYGHAQNGPQRRRARVGGCYVGAVLAQKVFFRNPKEVERYHGFPRGAVTLWPARMQAVCKQNAISFGEFCASLKGDDEKPRVNRFCDRRCGSGRTNLPHSHRGGYPSHAERRTADAHTGTTVSSACDSLAREGVCSRLHRGRGRSGGGVSDYVACALAVW
jgi:hypothetical protein